MKQAVEVSGILDVHWTLKAEAAEYRESLSIEKSMRESAIA